MLLYQVSEWGEGNTVAKYFLVKHYILFVYVEERNRLIEILVEYGDRNLIAVAKDCLFLN